MKKFKFDGHPKANAYYVKNYSDLEGKYYALYSYDTLVAICIINENISIKITGLYSITTRKHIGWWLKMLYKKENINLNYYDIKRAYEKGAYLKNNIHIWRG